MNEKFQAPAEGDAAMAELVRLANCCPELNLSNYGPDDVDELNAWAIEVAQEIDRLVTAQPQPKGTAAPSSIERFNAGVEDGDNLTSWDRLKYFCSIAMSGQDWLDSEPLFDAVELQLPSADCDDCNCMTQCGDAAAWAEEVAQMTGSPEVPPGERWCLWCDKAGHQTHECWSTHGVNTPEARELWRLSAASVKAPAPAPEPVGYWLEGSSVVEFGEKRDYHDGPEWTAVYVQPIGPSPAVGADDARDAARYRKWRGAHLAGMSGAAQFCGSSVIDMLYALGEASSTEQVDTAIDAAMNSDVPVQPIAGETS